jgi:hypothetical protein
LKFSAKGIIIFAEEKMSELKSEVVRMIAEMPECDVIFLKEIIERLTVQRENRKKSSDEKIRAFKKLDEFRAEIKKFFR